MNKSRLKRAAAVSGSIYIVIEVVLYVIGLTWPEAAPHAQFISGKVTPLLVMLSNFLILGDAGLPDATGPAEPEEHTTRGILSSGIDPREPIIIGSTEPRGHASRVIQPIVNVLEKALGFFEKL